jgi:antitoxin component YwqK of YwqJK toxin-antitoxin module
MLLNTLNKLIISLVFITGACGLQENGESKEWEGSEDSFRQEFATLQTFDSEQILISKDTNQPFFGRIRKESENFQTLQTFSGGKLHGKSVKQRKDGSRVEASFVNGLLHGEMNFYDSENTLRSSIKYHEGKLYTK